MWQVAAGAGDDEGGGGVEGGDVAAGTFFAAEDVGEGGGGFFDRTLQAIEPRPMTVGVSFTHGFLPLLRAGGVDKPLDAMLTEDGVMFQRPDA